MCASNVLLHGAVSLLLLPQRQCVVMVLVLREHNPPRDIFSGTESHPS